MDKSRQQFEEAIKNGFNTKHLSLELQREGGCGYYRWGETERCWEMWQASRASFDNTYLNNVTSFGAGYSMEFIRNGKFNEQGQEPTEVKLDINLYIPEKSQSNSLEVVSNLLRNNGKPMRCSICVEATDYDLKSLIEALEQLKMRKGIF